MSDDEEDDEVLAVSLPVGTSKWWSSLTTFDTFCIDMEFRMQLQQSYCGSSVIICAQWSSSAVVCFKQQNGIVLPCWIFCDIT